MKKLLAYGDGLVLALRQATFIRLLLPFTQPTRLLAMLVLSFVCNLSYASTFTVFGPETFEREADQPETQTATFELVQDTNIPYRLRVFNGQTEDGTIWGDFVNRGNIQINGERVVRGRDLRFNAIRNFFRRFFGLPLVPIVVPVALETENEIAVRLRSQPGTMLSAEIVGIDNDAPIITASVDPLPGPGGIHTGPVTVSFDCTDATSGIQSCTDPILVDTEGNGQIITGTAVDLAGNTATASITINIEAPVVDTTAPTISSELTPPANENGWNNADVTVSFDCNDDESGIASCTDPILVTEEGENQAIEGTAVDNAGNTATNTATVNLDKTVPEIIQIITPLANAAGWHNTDVSISFECDDALSGVEECLAPVAITNEGANIAGQVSVTDRAGNTGSSVFAVNVDRTPAQIAIQTPVANSVVGTPTPTVNIALSDANPLDSSALSLSINGVIAAFDCSFDTGSASCVPDALLVEGGIVLAVAITDIAGNLSTTQVPFEILIDADNDGVSDSSDLCPNTPVDAVVDVNGCALTQLDADNDGISDAVDVCPATPAGESVDAEGCSLTQLDTDNDGVSDAVDICPNTPSGETVDAEGCSSTQLDGDNDGVSNVSDLCPNTPEGEIVDAEGCSLSQLDSDDDGVSDAADICPATPQGETVDVEGCSLTQLDTDSDGVSDALDTCPATPAGESVDAEGCSPSQLDSDNDGVIDESDLCPGTSDGAVVDADGCSLGQLDSDNDGVTDDLDQCADTPADEVVDQDGCSAAQLDTQGPELSILSPLNDALVTIEQPLVSLSFSDVSGIDNDSITLTLDGVVLTPSCQFDQTGAQCLLSVSLVDGVRILSVSVDDAIGNTSEAQTQFIVDLAPVDVSLTSPVNGLVTLDGTVSVTGVVGEDVVSVQVNGVDASVSNGTFIATVPLREGRNMLVAVATRNTGKTGTSSVDITRDIVAPIVRIDSPREGFNSVDDLITVTGLVNDSVDGGFNAIVVVNGFEATVADGTFMVTDIPLVRGSNMIEVVATDSVGNESRNSITVNFQEAVGARVSIVSGNGQSELVNRNLLEPMIVLVSDSLGNPVAGSIVKFEVTRNSGLLKATATNSGQRILQMPTNGSGQASVLLQLGDTAGEGNNRVMATALGASGEVEFAASALASEAVQIAAIIGDSQRGIIGQPLEEPLAARVTDVDGNPITDMPVVFEVVRGDGNLDGLTSIQKTTDRNGIARAAFTLGSQPGINNNLVRASFVGLSTLTSSFMASGMAAGNPDETKFRGVVLDNTQTPIPGALVEVEGTNVSAVTDTEGQFLLENVPVGRVLLHIDPSNSPRAETFPPLEFETIALAGQVNILGQPILLPTIRTENARIVGGDEDVTLTMAGVDGLTLTVFANSVTFPNGSTTGELSISQVHLDKVPMPPPNGSIFTPPAWTIQPAGVHFDPPARVTIPNNGQPAGSLVDIFQFDHELNEFIDVGKGVVSEDGFNIVSDEGFGISRAGWGGAPPPPPPSECDRSCGDLDPDECQETEDPGCPACPFLTPRPPETVRSEQNSPNDCVTDTCGGAIPNDGETVDPDLQVEGDCRELVCKDGRVSNEPNDNDIDEEESPCRMCEDGGLVADSSQDGNSCGDGSPEQSCFVCTDGECQAPECDASGITNQLGFSTSIEAQNFVRRITDAVSLAVPGARVQVSPSFNGSLTFGEECCSDCTDDELVKGEYVEFAGGAQLQLSAGVGPAIPPINESVSISGGGFTGTLVLNAQFGIELRFAGTGAGQGAGRRNFECEAGCAQISGSASLASSIFGGVQINQASASIDTPVTNEFRLINVNGTDFSIDAQLGSIGATVALGTGDSCPADFCTLNAGGGSVTATLMGGTVEVFDGMFGVLLFPNTGLSVTRTLWEPFPGVSCL